MRWTLEEVARALGVALPAGLNPMARVAGVSIDSRTVRPGELFLAVRGPRHDGHDFVDAVLAAGAPAAIVAVDRRNSYTEKIRPRLIAVDDTLRALQQLGASVLRQWRTRARDRLVGAVAGSVGKTTTKEILAALLAARFSVLKSTGNLNNEYGLPLTLFGLEESHGAVVVELGMSRRGELARLTQIAAPDVGVITRIAVEHLEFFQSVDEIALAERELIENLPRERAGPGGDAGKNAVSVLNADDERVVRFADVVPGKVIWFGSGATADFRAENIEDRGITGTAFDLVSPEGRARLDLPLIGRHNVMNAIAALAAASVWGIGIAEAKKVFPSLQPTDKRGEVVRFADGFTVINDTYNSSPTALDALSDLLAGSGGHRRRILAAGEMLELGPSSPQLHRESGHHAATRGIDWIVGVRGDAAEIVTGAIAAGLPKERTRFFESSRDAAEFFVNFLQPGDLLLLKGSRGVKMEAILEALRARYAVKGSPSPNPAEPAGTGRR